MCCHCTCSQHRHPPEKVELKCVPIWKIGTQCITHVITPRGLQPPPDSPGHSPTSSSSSSLVSLIELFITSFAKVVYHTARPDEVTQRVNLHLIVFEQTPPFSFEPPKGSLYGQRCLTEPVVRVKLFSCYSCSFREARGVVDRRNQRGWQAPRLLPQLFRCILATVCSSGIHLKAFKVPQHGHHGLRPAVHYLCLKTSYCSSPHCVKW